MHITVLSLNRTAMLWRVKNKHHPNQTLNCKALLQWQSVKRILKTKTTVVKIAFGVSEANSIFFFLQGLACTYLRMTFRCTGVTIHTRAAKLMPAARPTRHAANPEWPTCTWWHTTCCGGIRNQHGLNQVAIHLHSAAEKNTNSFRAFSSKKRLHCKGSEMNSNEKFFSCLC